MARIWIMTLGCVALLAACTTSTGARAERDEAPANTPASATPETSPSTAMATQTPWRVSVDDGSHNAYAFTREGDELPARFTYDPVKAHESSSGTYDGGPAAAGALSDAQVEALWQRVRALQADGGAHVDRRAMGTVAIRWTTPDGSEDFIVSMAAAAELDALLQDMRSSAAGASGGLK